MAVIIPNRMSEALQRTSENILDTAFRARQLELERQRIALDARRVEEMEKTGALNTILNLSQFLPRDVPVKDLPVLHEPLKTIFPGLNPADDTDLGGLVFNPDNPQNVLNQLVMQKFREMPEGPEKDAFLERLKNFVSLGTPSSDTELQSGKDRAQLFIDSISALRRDPRALTQLFRTVGGLEPLVSVTLPSGEVRTWDTATAANLSIELLKHRDYLDRQEETLLAQSSKDLADMLVEQMTNHNISLGYPQAQEIVNAYTMTMQEATNPPKDRAPRNYLKELWESTDNPSVHAAIKVFTGASAYGEGVFNEYLASTEQGRQALMFSKAAEWARKNFPAENVPEILEDLSTIPGMLSYRKAGPFRRRVLKFDTSFMEQPENVQQQPENVQQQPENVQQREEATSRPKLTREQATQQAIQEVVNNATDPEEKRRLERLAREKYGDAVVDKALGVRPKTGLEKIESDIQQRKDRLAEIQRLRNSSRKDINRLELAREKVRLEAEVKELEKRARYEKLKNRGTNGKS